jgi:type IV secretion system protein VirB5
MRIMNARRWSLRVMVAACVSSPAVMAQGVPVIDVAGLAQAVQQFEQMRSQLSVLNQQYQQAQQAYTSVNRLTNMGDIASVLQSKR